VITTPTGAPVFPPGRYGRRREPRRRRPWLMAALVAAALLVGAVAIMPLYRKYGDPTYDAQVITYTGITDTRIDVTFRVTVPPGGSAICLVRARSRDHAEVGHADVRADAAPGARQAVVTHRLVTTARPMIGEVVRCRAA
jgi:Domain of unknown function (DUF4307)